MRLVKFDNGKFGVLRGRWFWTEALDIRQRDRWWLSRLTWEDRCMGTEDDAREAMRLGFKSPKWSNVK